MDKFKDILEKENPPKIIEESILINKIKNRIPQLFIGFIISAILLGVGMASLDLYLKDYTDDGFSVMLSEILQMNNIIYVFLRSAIYASVTLSFITISYSLCKLYPLIRWKWED